MPTNSISVFSSPVILLFFLITTANSGPIVGLDSFLTQQSHLDPHATNDSFLSLPSLIRHHLSRSAPPSFLSLSLSLSVHVILVGPTFSSVSITHLSSFLSSTLLSDHFHVISPFSSDSHKLALSHSPHIDVSLSSPSLSSSLSQTIKSQISASTSTLRSTLLSFPYASVDRIIKQDFDKEKPLHAIYLYLINLGPQERPYAYTYSDGESSPGVTKCSGSIWTGKERYIWLDLSAGPVDYGPGLSGDGLLPKGEFHPLATVHGRPKSEKAMLADVASLVASAYQVLLVPSLRIPVPFENSLVVQFIHIYSTDKSNDIYDNKGLDWKMIEKTFLDEVKDNGLILSDQSLSFNTYEVNYKECSICSFAILRAMTSYTSRFLFDNYTLIVNEYLDSKRLHQILSDSVEQFRGLAHMPEEKFGRVLPVYVFDLDFNRFLLLDRFHQTVAFKDMVIAVRTRNVQTVSDYVCNGRPVFTQTRGLERPLIGSILQSMWGVSPTHMVWSPRHNSTLVDYTWSIGQTPFGPFSEISSLSFVQKDAARRNVLLTSLNYTITSALDVLDSVSGHGGEKNLLKQKQHTEYIQRWNLFKYKLERAVSSLSHLDFEMASYFIRSSDHDLYAIHSIVYHASQELEASLTCFQDPPFPWASVSMYAVAFSALCYLYAKREQVFRNKRKQF